MGLGDLAFLVDHVGDAAGELVFGRIAGSVGEADRALGVAQQRKGKVELLGEGLVFLGGVEAGAEDLRVLRFVLRREVPEPGTLLRSARCVGFRIEPEDDFLTAQVGKPDAVAVVIHHIEIGSFLAGLKHFRPSSEDRLQDAAQ